MKNWEAALMGPNTTLREALESIDKTGAQIALIVDPERKLLGTFTDGDARRSFLRGLTMSDKVSQAMHCDPTYVQTNDSRHAILSTMRRTGLHCIPVIDHNRVVKGLALINDYLNAARRDNWVVIMAGGLGSRLQELTRDVPKPMLKVGSRPLLETIIRSYASQGFHKFYLAVNYKAEQIEAHFGNGHSLGVDIRYVREQQRMGTAGALSLLPEIPEQPFIVTNADLLTNEDYGHMMDCHIKTEAHATMAVRHYEMQVPFGVVRVRGDSIEGIDEKPTHRFVVSAGVYALSPEVLKLVPQGQFFDMPSLFEAMLKANLRTHTHHIDGYWLDIGRLSDYERANSEFNDIFQ